MPPSCYADVERLGEGAWSTLYRAVRTSDGCRILLEVLNPEQCPGEPSALLANQLEIGKAVPSDVLLTPLGASTFEGRPALELQDSHGVPLQGLLGTAWPVDDFLELAIRLSCALAELHERSIVHGALQPRYVLVNRDTGAVLLSGFWHAQRATRDGLVRPPAVLLQDCLPYLSPEQTGRLNRRVDGRTDLYSLGLIFFELLTARKPFEADNAMGWVHCHLARKPPVLEELVPSIPAVLSSIVLRLLEKAPEERYQSVAGLLQDLRQCQSAVGAGRAIAPFPLGRADVAKLFTISQKLYGRDCERALLLEQLEAVASGAAPSVVLISGPSGVGKSSLVYELQRPCAVRGVRFIAAKFEQQERDVPYAAVVDALRELTLDVLAGGGAQIEADRQRIAAAVSVNAALVCALIPELSLILGPQPPPVELPPAEIQMRLRAALRRCFVSFATRTHPVLMFVDDLQWGDPASLELLGDLAIDTHLRHLAIVAAHRDVVDPSHPLRRLLDRLGAAGALVETLSLAVLSAVDLRQLVADLTHAPYAEAWPLAQLIHQKTAGNPLFVVQLLSELQRRALIVFDAHCQRWRWDIAAILAQPCSDNVSDLLVATLRNLPADCQEAVGIGAYLGREFDLGTLARVLARDPGPALRIALERGLLLSLDRQYRFPHDRVQEAAYSLIAESERAATHLRIGRLLLAGAPIAERSDRIFEIANHMNHGSSLVALAAERESLAELNLLAGRRARASGSQLSARVYFAAGSALLGEDEWERRYDLAFPLALGQAECELATGELEAAGERLGRLASRARGFLDQAAVVCARATLSLMQSEFLSCIELLLRELASVGFAASVDPSEDAIHGEYEQLRSQLGDRSVEDLVELGEADAATQAIMELLFLLIGASTASSDRLMRLCACRMARLSLERGHCDASAPAYVYFGQAVGPYFGDYDIGFRFARLGLTLLERRRQSRFRERVLVLAGAFVYPWTRPLSEAAALLFQGLDAALENGDPTSAWLALSVQVYHGLLSGVSLAEVDQRCQRAAEFVRQANLGPFFRDAILICERLVRALRGLTPRFPSFDEGDFDESRFEAHVASSPALVIVHGWYWIRKLEARLYGGDYAGALAAAARAEPLLWTTGFATQRVEYHFYRALALAAQFELASAEERPLQRAALGEHARALAAWARGCAANFSSRALLVAAEVARIDGDEAAAAQGYEQAIRLSDEAHALPVLALGYEAASRFYRARGFALIADTYLSRAASSYRLWGADGKVHQLEQQYPSLVLPGAFGQGALLGLRAEQLDLLAVFTASQKISSMVVREQLLDTLLQIVLEHGGARRARLVLAGDAGDGQTVQIAAEAAIDDAGPVLPPAPRVPASIIEYVQRTGSLVLLDDAARDGERFTKDPYFAHARARSVLCLPVRRHGAVVGVLYLDNDLTPGIFTPERLVALELLATQAAVSLQNAELLARERAAREEAQSDRRRALLLGEVSAQLSDFGNGAALSRVVRLTCEWGFADWALLDVVGSGATRRAIYAHRDAAKERLLIELERRYTADFAAALLGAHTRGANAPMYRAALSDEQLRPHCVDDEHAALLRELGSRALLIVPLIARGARIGALSLMAGTPHHFHPGDIEVGVEIGRRLAMAIDAASLAELESRLLQSQKMEAIGRLAGGVAHDFNNLLTVILGYSQAAQEQLTPPEELREDMEEIRKAGERGAELTGQLLSFSRSQLVERRAINLNQVVTDLHNMMAALLGSRITLSSRLSERLWSTRADPGQMDQVLMNLAANARDAMPRGGKLLIETANVELDEAYVREHVSATAGEYVMLSVTDTGCGMERELQARIFEPFFTTKERGKGTGLGLATVFGIVRQSGGHVAVDSEVDRGTTFRIYLPRCAAPADEIVASFFPPAPTSGHGTETILLVEDDEQVRKAISAMLQQRGYTVLGAAGPGDAILISEQHPAPIDLLLSDVVMPLMTGPELAERVLAARPKIRRLFISGYTGAPVAGLAFGEDRVECVQKPFTPDKLVQAMRQVLDLQSADRGRPPG